MKNRKKILSALITLAVLVIVAALVVPQFASYEDVVDTIRTLSSSDVAIILLVTLANIMVYTLPFSAATPGIRFWPAFTVRQTSFLISNGIPGGGTIGIGVQYAMTTSFGVKGSTASSGIVSTSIWNMLTTISLPGLSLLLLYVSGQSIEANSVLAILGIVVAFVAIGGFILLMKNEALAKKIASALERWYAAIRRKLSFLPKLSLTQALLDFRKASYSTTVKRWPYLVSSNLLQQFAQYFVLYVILQLLIPGPVPFFATLAAFAFARIGTFIPLTPGGLGTVDAIMISLLVQAGIDSDIAAAATLLWRATTYFPQLFIGLGTFLYWRYRSLKRS